MLDTTRRITPIGMRHLPVACRRIHYRDRTWTCGCGYSTRNGWEQLLAHWTLAAQGIDYRRVIDVTEGK
jgi:hypothetical protein